MVERKVYVRNDARGNIIEIYKGFPDPGDCFSMTDYAWAVSEIRKQVFARAKGCCEFCGTPFPFGGGHMHEKLSRGRGGLISLTNCAAICAGCHRKEHPGIGGGVE